MCAAIAGKTACHTPASFSNVCSVATSVDQLDDVTITTCCALPTLASCWTSSGCGAVVGGGFGDAVGVGEAVLVGVGAAVLVGVADGDDVGVPTRAGLTTAGLETAGLVAGGSEAGAAVLAAAEVACWLLGAGSWLEAAGWLLVQAASVQAVALATSHRAALSGRSCLAWPGRRIWPG
jgi:hypothetical protein